MVVFGSPFEQFARMAGDEIHYSGFSRSASMENCMQAPVPETIGKDFPFYFQSFTCRFQNGINHAYKTRCFTNYRPQHSGSGKSAEATALDGTPECK
jgi:hypothetical protein